jgi:hypothetical protein
MNAKLRKLVKITAAGLFLIALAINVKVTLEDPFTMVNENAAAATSTKKIYYFTKVIDCGYKDSNYTWHAGSQGECYIAFAISTCSPYACTVQAP